MESRKIGHGWQWARWHGAMDDNGPWMGPKASDSWLLMTAEVQPDQRLCLFGT